MLHVVFNLLYPASCQACGVKTDAWNENICVDCISKIKKRIPPFCKKCGRQLSADSGSGDICGDCINGNVHFDRAFSVFHYDGALKEIVHNFKYNKVTCVAKDLSILIMAFMKQHNLGIGIDIAMSIPMHPLRLFKREMNPSDILARNIAKRLGIPYSGNYLRKIKNTPQQSKLNRQERIKNIQGTFFLRRCSIDKIRHKNILLVDDLFTTGATVNECARVLKKAGSGRVDVITLARGDSLP